VIQADLSLEQDVKRLVDVAQRQLGDLSFCVNLASDYPRTPYQSLTTADWDHAMAAAKGAYLLALESSRAMQRNAGPTRGHIVFFGDWAAEETPYRDFLPYLTAKPRSLHDPRLRAGARTAWDSGQRDLTGPTARDLLWFRAPNGSSRWRKRRSIANRRRKTWPS